MGEIYLRGKPEMGDTTAAPAWAAKYTTETLYRALGAAYAQLRDPGRLFDAAWQAVQAERIAQITAELERREAAAPEFSEVAL